MFDAARQREKSSLIKLKLSTVNIGCDKYLGYKPEEPDNSGVVIKLVKE